MRNLLNVCRHHSMLVALLSASALFGTAAMALLLQRQMVGLDLDDPWYMYFAWRLANHGGLSDPLFHSNGVQGFGYVWASLLALAYRVGGWSLDSGHVLSMSCVLTGSAVWFRLCERLGWTWPRSVLAAVLLTVLLPFVRAGISARPEAFVWLLGSVAVICFDLKWYVVTGFLAGLALETHPMGLVASGYVAAWAARTKYWSQSGGFGLGWRQLGLLLLGMLIAGSLYFAVHGLFLLQMISSHGAVGVGEYVSWQTPVFAYFSQGSVSRRVWVGAVSVLAISLYVGTGKWRHEPLPAFIAIAVMAAFLLVPRANPLYFVYIAPAIVLALAASLPSTRDCLVAAVTLTVTSWAGYIATARANWGFTDKALELRLRKDNPGNLPVATIPTFWPVLRCDAELYSMFDVQHLAASGNPFVAVVDTTWNLRGVVPRASVDVIKMTPRVEFQVYRVPGRKLDSSRPQSDKFHHC